MIDESDGAQRASDSLPLLEARYVVETEEWKIGPIGDDTSNHALLATGLSAVRTGDVEAARRAAAELEARAADGGKPVQIMHLQVAALVAAAEDRAADATALMDDAIAVVETMRPPNGAANPVKPPYELYGELLLDLGQPESAAEKFEHSLLRMPGRARSLLGAARASAGCRRHGYGARALRDADRQLARPGGQSCHQPRHARLQQGGSSAGQE